jgi:2-succinyl-6-hydroxy-2,4-cyclohexadiene-1-carboxylate synthase
MNQHIHEQWVEANPYRFYVRQWNPAAASRQTRSFSLPIVWLHGFMGSGSDWDEVIHHWGDRPLCIAIDLPGHGKTTVTGAATFYSMPLVARGILHLLDALHIDRCGLVGYSMGGRLALYLALHAPTRFCGVVLESASPGLRTATERQARQEQDANLAQKLMSTDLRVFLGHWYQQPLFAALHQHPSFPAMVSRRLLNDPAQLGRSLRYMGTGRQPSLWNALSNNDTPLRLIVGEHDSKYRQIAAEMGDRHPHCSIITVPNCGHTVHLEQPMDFTRHIHSFYSKLRLA